MPDGPFGVGEGVREGADVWDGGETVVETADEEEDVRFVGWCVLERRGGDSGADGVFEGGEAGGLWCCWVNWCRGGVERVR